MLRYLLSFLATVLVVKSATAPFIKACKSDDSECVLASAQASVAFIAPGIPELGVKPVDPLFLPLVKSEEGGLQLTFRNTTVTGMKGCSVDAIKHDLKKGKQVCTIRCSVLLQGEYTMSGRLLVLPISGDGRLTIKIRDIVIKAYVDLATVAAADGNPHWHITKWRHTFKVKTNTHFDFENLFNGNKLLGDPVLQFANNNWRDVMQEIAPPIVRAIVAQVIDSVEAIYKAVPAKELMLE